MNKNYFSFLVLLFLSFVGFAQADIDKEYFPVSYVGIPDRPIRDENKRTYDVKVEMPEAISDIISEVSVENLIQINGFIRNETTPFVNTSIQVSNLFIDAENMKITERRHRTITEDGGVDLKHSNKYYVYSFPYSINATYEINCSLYPAQKGFAKQEREFESTSFSTKGEAYNHYQSNIQLIKENITHSFLNFLIYTVNNILNNSYGYKAVNKKDYLWILDSKRNPFTEAHKKAISDVFFNMKQMRYNKPIEDIKKNTENVIKTFDSIANLIPAEKRRDRKVRYACFYNSAVLSYYIDEPQQSSIYAEKALKEEFNNKEATVLINKSEELDRLLKLNNIADRHMDILQDEKFNAVENEDASSTYAFLITTSQDTLVADLNWDDVPLIGTEVKVYLPDTNGNMALKIIPASDILELVIDENNIYVQKKFISYKDNPRAKEPGYYLVRKEFESNVISLYSFKEEEGVLFLPDQSTGHSTRSYKFIMGLKNELPRFSNGCPGVNALIKEGYYKNSLAGLRTFAEDVVSCE
ncbi:hypothetical protein [Abyssalbus ytuae]|uniref:Uncharacterized protein n=1 Tax=Abyssalbus ytuae TaxID=2926907 RepID=A0A9E6ZLA5_9FLAO|nr:hypothetical protein [Abyssalbus ytuae]UOB16230.1 hypothetical protein MQE35_10830 [Abyssalbus ytuae]